VVVIVVAVITERRSVVAVENDADHLGRIQKVKRFSQQPAWGFVGADNDEEAINPFPNEPAIR